MKIQTKEIFTISNMLSMLRLLLSIPIFYMLYYLHDASFAGRLGIAAALLFAASTDWMDGYFARKRNEITEMGKIIDPLADKVAIAVIVIQLFLLGEIPAYFFYIVIARDVLIFLGGIIITSRLGKVLPSNMLGKITVTVIAVYILAIVLGAKLYAPAIHYLLEYISVILVIASFIGYVIRANESLKWKKNGSV